MPSHIDVPANEIKAVVLHQTPPRWKQDKPESIAIKAGGCGFERPWPRARRSEGHEVLGMPRGKGVGDGPSVATLKDDWGDPSVPFDFTSGALKGGPDIEDIYRTFTTGVDGSPMPSYADSLGEADRWHLVSYSLKMMGKVK
jgi:hypothetical protein